MATVTMAYMRAIVESRYDSDRINKMPDHQIAAIYQRIISQKAKPTANLRRKPTYNHEDGKGDK